MSYSVFIENYAFKQLKQISKDVVPRIKEAISSLSHNSRPNGYIKLKGIDAFRIRVGDYRIIIVVFLILLGSNRLICNDNDFKEKIIQQMGIVHTRNTASEFVFHNIDSLISMISEYRQIVFIANNLHNSLRFSLIKHNDTSIVKLLNYKEESKRIDYCFILPEKNGFSRILFYDENMNLVDTLFKFSNNPTLLMNDSNFNGLLKTIEKQRSGYSSWFSKTPYDVYLITKDKKSYKSYILESLWEYNNVIDFEYFYQTNNPEKHKLFNLLIELNKIGVFRKMEYYGQ